ncbi:MAG: DsbA family protein [Thaumarchaeota archaeon]|nr:DsbA family protein [Nitrososphaerota archaeon]
MSEDVPTFVNSQPDDTGNSTSTGQSSNNMLKGMVVAIAVAAFFAGYFAATLTDSDGITDEQMDMIISEIDSKVIIQADENPSQAADEILLVSLDDDPIKGSPDAEITIVEFSDFQCPFCARFYEQTLPLIEQEYLDTGKANLVYRDFPLQIHANAVPAHIASECADEQGQFWLYHDVLFERQKEWESIPRENIATILIQYSEDLGLDRDEFESCLNSNAMSLEIQNDYQDGVKYGVRGTPAFFVGNDDTGYVALSGAQPFEVFQRVIESKLG